MLRLPTRFLAKNASKSLAQPEVQVPASNLSSPNEDLSVQEIISEKHKNILDLKENDPETYKIFRKQQHEKHTALAQYTYSDQNENYLERAKTAKPAASGFVKIIPHPGQYLPGKYGEQYKNESLFLQNPVRYYGMKLFKAAVFLSNPAYKPRPGEGGMLISRFWSATCLPYDSSIKARHYYKYAVHNLMEEHYSVWNRIPTEVKLHLNDNFINMSRFAIVNHWLLNKYFTDVPLDQAEKDKISIVPKFLQRTKQKINSSWPYLHIRDDENFGKEYREDPSKFLGTGIYSGFVV